MTHTEESLMVLADALLDDSQPYIRRELTHHSLRLAIREVLADRDEWKRMHEELAHASNESLEGVRELVQRAEKAEAECERLIAERQGKIDENPGHEYWMTASHDEILDALRFQGAMTKELMSEMERAVKAERECERLRNDLSVHKRLLDNKIADCISWINENERLRKDAERYRWIEKRVDIYGNDWATGVVRTAINRSDGARLDAAIDAALKEQP